MRPEISWNWYLLKCSLVLCSMSGKQTTDGRGSRDGVQSDNKTLVLVRWYQRQLHCVRNQTSSVTWCLTTSSVRFENPTEFFIHEVEIWGVQIYFSETVLKWWASLEADGIARPIGHWHPCLGVTIGNGIALDGLVKSLRFNGNWGWCWICGHDYWPNGKSGDLLRTEATEAPARFCQRHVSWKAQDMIALGRLILLLRKKKM